MTKRFALMLILLLPLMAGCLTDSGDDDDDKDGSGLTATSYIPMATGITYSYTDTTTGMYYTVPIITPYTTRFSGPVTKNNISYYRMIDDYGDDWSDTTYVRVSNNTFYMIENFWDIAVRKQIPATRYEPLSNQEDIQTEVEIPFIDFNTATWNIYSGTRANEIHEIVYSWTGKYLGRETVTVPAGTFSNTAKFEITMLEDNSPVNPEETWSYISEYKMVLWLAADIGVVKSTISESYTDSDEDLLQESFTVTALTSYDIP